MVPPAPPTPGARITPPSRWRQTAAFLRGFVASPTTIAAVAPSSRALAARMVEGLDLEHARAVVEFGPGTGAFTDAMLPRLGKDTRYFAIDISPTMCRLWSELHPGMTILQDSVAHVDTLCARQGIDRVDYILSGLPWASFPDALQTQTLDGVRRVLRPGGQMVTFGYHIGTMLTQGKKFYKRLPEYFAKVEYTPYVWRNLPPAFVVRCTA